MIILDKHFLWISALPVHCSKNLNNLKIGFVISVGSTEYFNKTYDKKKLRQFCRTRGTWLWIKGLTQPKSYYVKHFAQHFLIVQSCERFKWSNHFPHKFLTSKFNAECKEIILLHSNTEIRMHTQRIIFSKDFKRVIKKIKKCS